ncbi:MAG: Flp pilus assembly protein CpaB [Candidatus Limnocylindrales bacterium]
MRRSNRPLILLGALLAILAFFGVYVLSSGGSLGTPSGSPTARPTVAVVVAKTDISLGAVITADMLGSADKDATSIAADAVTAPRTVVGLRIRQEVAQGQVLTNSMFHAEGVATNEQLLRNLDPGFRAMAIQVDQVGGVGSLIQAGDHVDVVLALEGTDSKFPVVGSGCAPSGPPPLIDQCINSTSVKVLVQDSKVLGAILPPLPADKALQQAVTGSPTLTGLPIIVILQLRPQEVELVRFAQLDGNISLVLRAIADAGAAPAETSGITLAQLVAKYGVLPGSIIKH